MTAMRAVATATLTVMAVGLSGCAGSSAPSPDTTSTRTIVTTRTVAPPTGGAPATSVAPLPRSGKAPKGEIEKTCPYIKAGKDAEPTNGPNIADLEGDRVGTVTVLPNFDPVGCRFYFAYSYGTYTNEAVADIQPFTFGTALQARNAMIRTATTGKTARTVRNFVPGLVGIQYQTRFFGPDGDNDWAFVFAKGTRMVIVHTQQDDAQLNAQNIAAAIAHKF